MFNPFAPAIAEATKDGAVLNAMTYGIEGFFTPRPGATVDLKAPMKIEDAGFYDTSPLRKTLLDHVNFDYLNSGAVRLTVCAVDVATGEMKQFDTCSDHFTPEHIMASGALPPAFPPIMVDGRAYWDGGIYSNTPLEVLLNEERNRDALVFMIDLWDSTQALPKNMTDVMDRVKSIEYAGRASTVIDTQSRLESLRQVIRSLSAVVPEASLSDPEISKLIARGCGRTVNVVRLIMKSLPGENQFKDVDFTAATVNARWGAGMADAARALKHKAWLKPVPPHAGLVIHELEQV